MQRFDEPNGFFQSRAIRGLVLVVLAFLLDKFGFKMIDPDATYGTLEACVTAAIALYGAVRSAWGTIDRKGPIQGLWIRREK